MTAASATDAWATRADSISAVDSRWPDTLITSSIAAGDPEVAVLVPAGAVPHEVHPRAEPGEVGLDVAVLVVVQGAEHARPGLGEDQQAVALGDLAAVLVEQAGGHAGQRPGRRAWLGRGEAG